MELSGMPEKMRRKIEKQDLLASLKELIEESQTDLGEEDVGGRKAKKYRVKKGATTFTIWADAKTGDPVKMELIGYQGNVVVTVSDLRFNEKMDESLFSTEAPEGFTMISKDPVDVKTASTEDLVEFFRFWAACREGTFPPNLSENQWLKDCMGHIKKLEKDLSKADLLAKLLPHSRARLFLQMRPHLQDNYAGSGVKQGAKDKAIFWYKPDGAEAYTVIYGDLSVKKDVAEDDLPADP